MTMWPGEHTVDCHYMGPGGLNRALGPLPKLNTTPKSYGN